MTLVQYKLLSGGGYVTLMDVAAGGVMLAWAPDGMVNSVQRENLAAAVGQLNNSYRQPLGNLSVKLSMQLSVTLTTEDLAAAYARTTMINLLGAKAHFLAVFGSETQYYPNGVVNRCKCNYQGSTVEINIEAETDMLTNSAV